MDLWTSWSNTIAYGIYYSVCNALLIVYHTKVLWCSFQTFLFGTYLARLTGDVGGLDPDGDGFADVHAFVRVLRATICSTLNGWCGELAWIVTVCHSDDEL